VCSSDLYWLVVFADSDLTLGPSPGVSAPSVSLTGYTELPTVWPTALGTSGTGALSMWINTHHP
jgi:hypothetical protein